MEFVLLVFKGRFSLFTLLLLLGLLTGAAHVGLFVKINEIIEEVVKGNTPDKKLISVGTMLLLFYMLLNRFLSKKMISLSQEVIHNLRLRLIRSSVNIPYQEMMEKKKLLNAAVAKDTILVSQAALSSVYLITSTVTVLGSAMYLGFLSLPVLGALLVATLLGITFYLLNSRKSLAYLQSARRQEDVLFHHAAQVFGGFREIKINPQKAGALIEGPLLEASLKNKSELKRGLSRYFDNSMTGQFLFYLVLLLILYAGTGWFKVSPVVLVNCVFVILYLIGPLEAVMVLMPNLAVGNVAASRLNSLLSLVKSYPEGEPRDGYEPRFESLKLSSLHFDYVQGADGQGFSLGPIDFELKRGETVFVFGGNGSGKTTFFHILLGLIRMEEGEVFLNGQKIAGTCSVQYLFSPMFSDFYLFDKCYGLSNINYERANYYLELFELNGKVRFDTDHFSTLDLSTGQRKRLGLIVMLLENRPLLFLDEWAADQDPFFREKFYTEILPLLKKEGFTILAITHDDKYYHTADKLYMMDMGRLNQIDNEENRTFLGKAQIA